MSKDPAFLFYSQDFYTGVATLNWEERGKFISILCLMHQKGRMNEETIRFLVGSVSDNLKAKFRIDENGLWYNERLEKEAAARAKFTESRRLNGKNGGRPKNKKASAKATDNHKQNHMVNHMEDENEDVNEIENKLNSALDEIYLDNQKPKWGHIDFDFEVNAFREKVIGSPDHYRNHDSSGLRLAFQSQLRNAKKKYNGTDKQTANLAANIQAFQNRWPDQS